MWHMRGVIILTNSLNYLSKHQPGIARSDSQLIFVWSRWPLLTASIRTLRHAEMRAVSALIASSFPFSYRPEQFSLLWPLLDWFSACLWVMVWDMVSRLLSFRCSILHLCLLASQQRLRAPRSGRMSIEMFLSYSTTIDFELALDFSVIHLTYFSITL